MISILVFVCDLSTSIFEIEFYPQKRFPILSNFTTKDISWQI